MPITAIVNSRLCRGSSKILDWRLVPGSLGVEFCCTTLGWFDGDNITGVVVCLGQCIFFWVQCLLWVFLSVLWCLLQGIFNGDKSIIQLMVILLVYQCVCFIMVSAVFCWVQCLLWVLLILIFLSVLWCLLQGPFNGDNSISAVWYVQCKCVLDYVLYQGRSICTADVVSPATGLAVRTVPCNIMFSSEINWDVTWDVTSTEFMLWFKTQLKWCHQYKVNDLKCCEKVFLENCSDATSTKWVAWSECLRLTGVFHFVIFWHWSWSDVTSTKCMVW